MTALKPREAAALLHAAAGAIEAELSGLPLTVLTHHPAPGEWCAHEVLGHLIEAERRGFAGRVRILLDGDDPALQTWDQDEVAAPATRLRARRDGAARRAQAAARRERDARGRAAAGRSDAFGSPSDGRHAPRRRPPPRVDPSRPKPPPPDPRQRAVVRLAAHG